MERGRVVSWAAGGRGPWGPTLLFNFQMSPLHTNQVGELFSPTILPPYFTLSYRTKFKEKLFGHLIEN